LFKEKETPQKSEMKEVLKRKRNHYKSNLQRELKARVGDYCKASIVLQTH